MDEGFEDITPTHEADVVVVGGGGGGMSAAIAATEADPTADVLLLQKIGELGGSTTMSVGSLTASGTHLQADRGIEDSPGAHYEDIDRFIDQAEDIERYAGLDHDESLRDRDDTSLREVLVEESAETLRWLCDHGCEYAGPYLESPHRVPRMHQITPDTTAYRDVLGDVLESRGVEVLYNTAATELVVADGAVRGVAARQEGTRKTLIVSCTEGVVLATGDYVAGMDYREQYTDDAVSEPINEHNTGDGHRMGEAVGAELVNMDMQYPIFRFGDPLYTGPELLSLLDAGSMLVSAAGERFVNEDAEYGQIYDSVLRQDLESVYLVLDDDVAQTFTAWPDFISTLGRDSRAFGFLEDYRETDYMTTVHRLSDLTDVGGIDGETLVETLQSYNTGVYDEHHDMYVDRFGRTESYNPLTEFPLYVLGPIRPYVVITLGGLRVDPEMQVLDAAGDPIEGLYAAGSIAGSFLMFGHGHHHSWIFTSGRLAGREVVAG